MKQISEDIKSGQFHRVYLLYGEERYLKEQYKHKLLSALGTEGDTMNFSRFEGKSISEAELIDLAETLPFFADHRVILLEDTGFFKNKSEKLPAYLENPPEHLVMIFAEQEVDKRNKLYKTVGKSGYTAEFSTQKTEVLMRWILGILKKENKKITQPVMELFLEKTGTDMGQISQELEKLLSYTMGQEVIREEDVRIICTNRVENQIFAMVRAVSEKKQKKALQLYYDLLSLKEPPMRILYLLAREMNLILQVKELKRAGFDQKTIASKAGIAPFAVRNYLPLAERYTSEVLKGAVEDFTETETAVKTGKLSDVLSVEMMIVKYSENA
ncbi:MAG: DNA polymerase III subunit delta [Lachnospiraceae bacterium]|nr:DNA polymerase III subunit delta [Lachnospiraceae bacterium]